MVTTMSNIVSEIALMNQNVFTFPSHIPSELQVDVESLQTITGESFGCMLLLELKHFLKQLYGFADRYDCSIIIITHLEQI